MGTFLRKPFSFHIAAISMRKNSSLPYLLFFLFLSQGLWAQNLKIQRASYPIKLDGVMDEKAWAEADVAEHFNQYFPFDTSEAVAPTEVRMTYDDNNIYVIAKLHNLGPRNYVTPSLRRDFRGEAFDGFTLILDTYKDKTNAFIFGVNPYGVQREGLISEGGNGGGNSFSLTWDNKWYAEAKIYEDYWIAEMAVPFRTIRFKENMDSWYINFYRIDSEYTERSTWAPIPRNFSIINLAYNKELIWDKPLKNPGRNISIIPYMAYSTSKNFEEGTPTDQDFNIGGDAKVALTSALNLDLTINPDFSQVETDQQVTNLDRFEIFFPEQRQFFLENADLFANFGTGGARPFFSRRIGVARDTVTGTNISNQLYVGARVSGNLNNKFRLGLLSVQAAEEEDISLPSINYTVVSTQYRIGQRSNISGIFINKQAFQDSLGGSFEFDPPQANRTLGFDLNLATPDNAWSGKGYYHQTIDGGGGLKESYSTGISLNHQTYRWDIFSDIRAIGSQFNPEVGFVRRTDFNQFRGAIFYNFYPSKGAIQSHAPGFDWDFLRSNVFGITDWDLNIRYRISFQNTARFNMRLRRQYVFLFNSFDPSGSDGQELPADTDYTNNLITASYNSDNRRNFFYSISTRSGGYFNGSRINLEGTLSYRFLPYAVTSVNFEYNRIRLPNPYSDADLYLIGPRIDITFSRSIFWTTFIQYNSQISNMNINTRFQWRYSPVSDLFIVYSDNYEAGEDRFIDFSTPRARALVVKLTYWLNI